MSVRMVVGLIGSVCLAVVLAAAEDVAQPPPAVSGPPAATEPASAPARLAGKLVAKQPGFFLHAIPVSTEVNQPAPLLLRGITSGHMLTLTSTATGQMVRLVESGTFQGSGATTQSMGVVEFRKVYCVFAGLAWDDQRVYVLTCEQDTAVLAVFSAQDGRSGKTVHLLPGKKRAVGGDQTVVEDCAALPSSREINRMKDDFSAGALKPIPNGVSCYGLTFEFTGLNLTKTGKVQDSAE